MTVPCTEVFAAIGANDYSATVDFYRRLFGREPDERSRDIYVAFHLPGLHLGIFEPRASNRPEFLNPADGHSSLNLVLRVPHVEQARTELAALNPVRPPGPIQPTNYGREFYAYDPEGNRLIVVERTSVA
jgi:predicted enzyme related to lactoylglutathione lyase